MSAETKVKNKSNGLNTGRPLARPVQAQKLPAYQTKRPQKGSATRYIIAIGSCVLLGGSYVVYTSTATKQAWYPVSANEKVVVPVSAPVEPPAPKREPPPPKRVVEESFHPVAIVNVPSVGLRNSPDIDSRAMVGSLRRGEGLEIVKRQRNSGPEWVKVRTKSGKVGWVFASVVKERRRG